MKTQPIPEQVMRGVSEVITKSRIERKIASGKMLRIKYGIDPTSTSFHLGHTVPLRTLRAFQELGHTAVFIIGDFTAQIGDPVGKSDTRNMLTLAQTQQNARRFKSLVSNFLVSRKTEVRFQSEWYDKQTLEQTIRLMATVTKEQLMRHETFRKREAMGKPLGFHEMFYTLLMAYDSVKVKSDIELGGPDQKFNFLVTRQVMKRYGLPPQDAMLLKYLPGTDGAEKMSKSEDNFVGLNEDPLVQFEKLMRIRDEDISIFLQLCTACPQKRLDHISHSLRNKTLHPIAAKRLLAHQVVSDCHGRSVASRIEKTFVSHHPKLNKFTLPNAIHTNVTGIKTSRGRDSDLSQ